MFLFDISNGLTLFLMLAATVLLIFLSQEEKKSYISAIALVGYIAILVMHVAQVATLGEEFKLLSRYASFSYSGRIISSALIKSESLKYSSFSE